MVTIQAKIDEFLKKESEKKRVRSGCWSPSALGRCYRYQYWNRADEPKTELTDARGLRVFACGNLFHDFVQQFYPDAQKEVSFKEEDVAGRADIVVGDEVIELKSVHSYQFHHFRKAGYDINKEKYANILQLMTCAHFLGKPKGRLVFISKDDLCISEYGFYLNAWEPEIMKELSTLRRYWDIKELPPPEPRAYGGKEGKYCPYWSKCNELGFKCPKEGPKKVSKAKKEVKNDTKNV